MLVRLRHVTESRASAAPMKAIPIWLCVVSAWLFAVMYCCHRITRVTESSVLISQAHTLLLATMASQGVCEDDWTLQGVGTTCREFDFSLAFSSLFLSVIPCILAICFMMGRLYRLRAKAVKIDSSPRSVGLLYSKIAVGCIAAIASLVSLATWAVSTASQQYGTLALAVYMVAMVRSCLPFAKET